MDIFEKLTADPGPLGQFSQYYGYFTFPKLEGPIGNKMQFRGKEVLVWSVNNYLGLANLPEVRKVDADAAAEWGLSYPMGARMMTGNSKYHEQLETELSEFVFKEDTILLNYGYMGIFSAIDALVDRTDVIVYDSESHACIIDGMRLHIGKRLVYAHNDIDQLKERLERATKMVEGTKGGILVITEGVFGMAGDQGKLKEIVDLKKNYNFRLLVDDAHGIGTLGETGAGAGQEQGVQDEIDLYFGTFAKSFASIGGFISGPESVIKYLRYNMRSQIFAKSLPMPIVMGALKRLDIMRRSTEQKDKLWTIASALQKGLKEHGFNIGKTNSAVTPVFLTGGPMVAGNILMDMRENHGIFCSVVTYPVIPKDQLMIRLIPTAAHTLEDVEYTISVFEKVAAKLKNGEYSGETISLQS